MHRKILTGSGLVLGLVLFLAVNILSNAGLQSARLDLTENRLFSLSDGTRRILASLEEPISLRLYLSQKLATGLPSINAYTVRVRELLEEYKRAAGGKLMLAVIDPEPFSEAEDRAVGYGLQGVPIDDGSSTFYFGLVATSSTDDEDIIPFFQPDREDLLEYDLTQLIYQLAHPQQKVVGLISTLPLGGNPELAFLQDRGGAEPWMILEQMRQSFDVRSLETDVEEIPADVGVLMLVHPKDLSDATLYAIDQFVLRGGHVLAFLDPYVEAEETPAGAAGGSNPERLLNAWGVAFTPSQVVGDLSAAKKVRYSRQSRSAVADYPVWMDVPPEQFDANDVVTGQLDVLTFATPGALKKKENAETELTPLIQTGPKAMQFDVARLDPLSDPRDLLRGYRPEGSFTLAARIRGKIKTAFPEGKPATEEPDAEEDTDNTEKDDTAAPAQTPETDTHLAESADTVNLIVVADTDLLQDRFWVQTQNFLGNRIAIPSAANGSFVINALDNLSGSNDLISVRNRGSSDRPFTRVRELQKEAELRFLEKEQELRARLQETEQKLIALQERKQGAGALILSPEQQQEVATFREEKIKIRKELRQVQHQLHKDIENLEARVKFMNIGFVPLLIGIGGIAVSARHLRRKKRSAKNAAA